MNYVGSAGAAIVAAGPPVFELVTTVERFTALEPAWGVLWRETRGLAFQSHPWLAAWVRDMGPSYHLRIGLLWHTGGTLAAVLPMAVRRFAGLRILEWAGQAVCDYCDGLGAPADLQLAWQALRRAGGTDIVRLKNIPKNGNITALISPGRLAADGDCLKVASQWESGDAWFRTLNKKKRNNFTRGQRILEEFGSTSIICHESVPGEALIGQLFELKKAWLRATGQSSYLIDDMHPGRLLNLAHALAKIGRLRLFVITCGDEIVSGSMNIAEGRSVNAFFAAYNPKFDRASPGIMLMTAYTRWAFNNGFAEIDYLRGDEGYKLEFANAHGTLLSFVAGMSLRGKVAVAVHRGWLLSAKFRERHKKHWRTGGAYTTKAGTARTTTVAE